MLDDSDLDAAVAAGRLQPHTARELRRFAAERALTPPEQDAHFRYRSASTDTLAGIGVALLLGGAMLAAVALIGALTGAIGAVAAWVLAKRFVAQRLGVPMTALFVVYAVGGVMAWMTLVLGAIHVWPTGVTPLQGLMTSAMASLLCWLWWARFRLPIAVAGAVLAALTTGDHVMRLIFPMPSADLITVWMMAIAVVTFFVAMWWDMTDIYRQTIRSDVAYWLHLLAGFKLAASGFRALFGTVDTAPGWATLYALPPADIPPSAALAGLALFGGYAVLGAAVDRRAVILVSLVFLWAALNALMPMAEGVATMLTGGFAVALVLWWRAIRRSVIAFLPRALAAQLPRTDPSHFFDRPVA